MKKRKEEILRNKEQSTVQSTEQSIEQSPVQSSVQSSVQYTEQPSVLPMALVYLRSLPSVSVYFLRTTTRSMKKNPLNQKGVIYLVKLYNK